MDVVIVRHAIAFDRDQAHWPDDRQRPLTPKGRKAFRRAARGLAALAPAVDTLLSSSYVRAWETALALTAAGWPLPVRSMALEATGSPALVLDALRAHTEAPCIALVGHEPYLGELLAYLLTGDAQGMRLQLRKGSAALLQLDDDLQPGHAQLRWLLQPKALRALAE